MSEFETMENTLDDSSCENLTFVITEPDVMFEDVYTEPVVKQESVSEDPVPEEQVPEESVKEELVVEDEPVHEEPVSAVEEPTPAVEEPTPAVEEPAPAVEEPEQVAEDPSPEEPILSVEESVQEEPVVAELESVPVVEEPVVAELESVPVVEEHVHEEPVLVVEEPVQEEPVAVVTELESVPVQEEPVVAELESVPVVEESVKEELVAEVSKIPQIVFIVPYRNRESHHKMFSTHMSTILQNSPHLYKIFYVHQTDNRSFNRGAMKNIGFLAVKNMYPNDYENITLVFNDIDTMPSKTTVINYITSPGTIKHFYGFNYTLGGIVSIVASDFEKLNGFPNFWSWGYEDNLLQIRAEKAGIQIDRSVFYKISDPAIIHLVDTPIREVNRGEYDRFLYRTHEGVSSIQDLHYSVDDETGFINVLQFNTSEPEVLEKRSDYDLRNGPVPFKAKKPQRRNPSMKMHF